MRTIALLVNPDKPHAYELQAALERRLADAGVDTCSVLTTELTPSNPSFHRLEQAELAFVIGGDGTLLGVSRMLAPYEIPLLGINAGHLGFLSEAEPTDLGQAVERVIAKDYELERRIMLETVVERDGQDAGRYIGLNDAVVGKGSVGRMCTVEIEVDGVLLDTYSGDGVIISTPTGSTAYSLSCGGPIVSPHLAVLVVTPICPHTLVARPCVIDVNQTIAMRLSAAHDDIGLTVDGQCGMRLKAGDRVLVRRSDVETTLVKLKEREFFTVLRSKLRGAVTTNQPGSSVGR